VNHNIPEDRLGTVGKLDDGRRYVHFKRHFNHPIETVWAAITDPNELAQWFPGFRAELRQGGEFKIWFGDGCDGPAHVTGTVTRYEPPNVFECGNMRYELEPTDNGCLLTFTDILVFTPPRSDEDIMNAVLGGWHKFLDLLDYQLHGGEVDPKHEPEPDYRRIEVAGRN